MARPQIGDSSPIRFRRTQSDGTCLSEVEEGKIVKVEESSNKSAWRLKVKTKSGTYTIHRSKKHG